MHANKKPSAATPPSAALTASRTDATDAAARPPAPMSAPAQAACVNKFSFPTPRHYDLPATLASGQVFRWRPVGDAWEGILSGHHFRLRQTPTDLTAELLRPCPPATAPDLLRHFLQLDADLPAILATFPDDPPMRAAVAEIGRAHV